MATSEGFREDAAADVDADRETVGCHQQVLKVLAGVATRLPIRQMQVFPASVQLISVLDVEVCEVDPTHSVGRKEERL
jgi:hypothetical protein